jgi:serine/threonine protein kinase
MRHHILQRSSFRAITCAVILAGLTHLHDLEFFHRDLKLANVAESEGPCFKLIDFGSSTQVLAGQTMSAQKQKKMADDENARRKIMGMKTMEEERLEKLTPSQKAHTAAPEIATGKDMAA